VDEQYAVVSPGETFHIDFYAHTGGHLDVSPPRLASEIASATSTCAEIDLGDGAVWANIEFSLHCKLVAASNGWSWKGVRSEAGAPSGCYTWDLFGTVRAYFNTDQTDASSSYFVRVCEPLAPFYTLAAWHVQVQWDSRVLEWGGTTTGDHGCTLVGDPAALLQDLPGNRTSFGFLAHGTSEVHGAFEHLGRCPIKLKSDVPTSTIQEAVLQAEVVDFVNNGGNSWLSKEQLVIVGPDNEVDWVLDITVASASEN
jgi:hypothetical protein